MDDLISRQAAIDALADMHCKSDEDGYVWIIRSDAWARIDALPSAQPERKTGEWIWKESGRQIIQAQEYPIHVYVCSECGYGNGAVETPYCPNCGSDMRGKDAD